MAFAIEFEQKCETLNSVSWVIFKPILKLYNEVGVPGTHMLFIVKYI
jgi:hypothetical protein